MDTIKVEFGNNHAFPWVLSTYAKPRESLFGPTQNTRYEAFVSMVTCLHYYWLLIGSYACNEILGSRNSSDTIGEYAA